MRGRIALVGPVLMVTGTVAAAVEAAQMTRGGVCD